MTDAKVENDPVDVSPAFSSSPSSSATVPDSDSEDLNDCNAQPYGFGTDDNGIVLQDFADTQTESDRLFDALLNQSLGLKLPWSQEKLIASVAEFRVLILLGEPDGLEKHLFRDIALSILHALGSLDRANALRILKDLVNVSADNGRVHDNKSGYNFFLLRNPTKEELKSFLVDTFYNKGEAKNGAMGYAIYFCGHGMQGGYLSLFGDAMSASALYRAITAKPYDAIGGFPTTHLYLNCCFSDEAGLMIGAQAAMLYANKVHFESVVAMYSVKRDEYKVSQNEIQALYEDYTGAIEHEQWQGKFLDVFVVVVVLIV